MLPAHWGRPYQTPALPGPWDDCPPVRLLLVALVRQHASWMTLCLDVLLLVSTPSLLLSPISKRLRICFPSSDTPGPWRLVSKRAVPRNASYRAGYLVRMVGLWP